jgi:hypothetical protein
MYLIPFPLLTEHFEEARSAPVSVEMRRKARILNPGEVSYGQLGETVHIRCLSEMVPSNGSLTWRRKVLVLVHLVELQVVCCL